MKRAPLPGSHGKGEARLLRESEVLPGSLCPVSAVELKQSVQRLRGSSRPHHHTAVADCGKETIKPAISGLEQEKALGPDKQTYPPLGWSQNHRESPTPESQGQACLRPRLNQDCCEPCAPAPSKPVWSPHWLLKSIKLFPWHLFLVTWLGTGILYTNAVL